MRLVLDPCEVRSWRQARHPARVLEKAGYVLEGRLRRSATKDGAVLDQLLYALVR